MSLKMTRRGFRDAEYNTMRVGDKVVFMANRTVTKNGKKTRERYLRDGTYCGVYKNSNNGYYAIVEYQEVGKDGQYELRRSMLTRSQSLFNYTVNT